MAGVSRLPMSDVSLRDYLIGKIEEQDRRLTQLVEDRAERNKLAITAAKEAVTKAEAANERRLALLNEFRAQSADEAKKYVPREVFGQMERRVSKNETIIANLQGKAILLSVGSASLGAAIAALVTKAFG